MGRDTKTKRLAEQIEKEKDTLTTSDISDLSTYLANLTDSEVQQLQNINSSTIAIAAWLALSKLSFSDDRVYVTNVSTARAIDRTSGVVISTVTVANTTDETTIFTGAISANDLKENNLLKLSVSGVYSAANASDTVTVRTYMGSTEISSITSSAGVVSNVHWDIDIEITVRSVGVGGTVSVHGDLEIGSSSGHDISEATVVDTTTSEDLTVTVQWDNNLAGNSISRYQGYLEFKG